VRWIKALAIGAGVLLVFFVVSTLIHIVEWAIIGIVVVAAIAGVFKARQQYRIARERRDQHRIERRNRSRSRGAMETGPAQADPVETEAPRAAHAPRDVEDDLARLKREMGSS
jgi:hypothetical protein